MRKKTQHYKTLYKKFYEKLFGELYEVLYEKFYEKFPEKVYESLYEKFYKEVYEEQYPQFYKRFHKKYDFFYRKLYGQLHNEIKEKFYKEYYKELYKNWFRLIYLSLIGKGVAKDVAKDLAIEAIIKFIEKEKEGRIDINSIRNISSYITRIAFNMMIDEYRKKARKGYFADVPLDEYFFPLKNQITNYDDIDFRIDKTILLKLALKTLKSCKGGSIKCLVFKELLRGYPSRTIAEKWWFNTKFAVGEEYVLKDQNKFFKKIENTVQSVKKILATVPALKEFFPEKKKECPHLTKENFLVALNAITSEAFAVIKKAIRQGLRSLTVPESKIWRENKEVIQNHPTLGPLCKESGLFSKN